MHDTQDMWVPCWGGEDSLANHMATHFSFLAWRTPMDRGTWWAMVRRVAKSQTPVKLLSTRQSELPRALGLPFGRDGARPRYYRQQPLPVRVFSACGVGGLHLQ